MKIRIKDKIYLQGYDVAWLIDGEKKYPDAFIDRFFEICREKNLHSIGGDTEEFHNFYYSFSDKESIDFIEKYEKILDFEKYASMKQKNLEDKISSLFVKRLPYNKTEHDAFSLSLLMAWKMRKIEFIFPDGYQPKSHYRCHLWNLNKPIEKHKDRYVNKPVCCKS